MKKRFFLLMAFMFLIHFVSAQEVNPEGKAEKNLIEIKKLIKLDEEAYQYIEKLLVYYYENGGDSKSNDAVNPQIIENIYNKLKNKLSEKDFNYLYDKWLKKNVK